MLSGMCGVVDALSDFQVKIMEAINSRFTALRRLAALLEQAGDLTGFIPDISRLVPISRIDVSLYSELRANCPYLNLPPVDVSPEQYLGELRAQVNAAYGRLLGQINKHPFSIMGSLQDKFNSFQSRINATALQGSDFLRCLQSVCATGQAFTASVNSLIHRSPDSILNTATEFYKNQVTGQGKILSDAAQAKANDIKNVGKGVQDLMKL